MKALLISLTLTLTLSATAAGGWMTDFDKAKEKAAKENKAILVNFTGSDWCGWCIKLKKEVFTKGEFKKYADKNLVLLELDFPRKKKLPAELTEQNKGLAEKFSVRGYPTILILDSKGRPVGKTGYQAGGPEKYNEHLNEFLTTKNKFQATVKEADSLEGEAKALKLADALKMIDKPYHSHYETLIETIKKNDPNDKTGIVKEQELLAASTKLQDKVKEFMKAKDTEGLKKALDEFSAKHSPEGELKQQVLFYNLFTMPYPPKTTEDLDKIDKLMDEIIAIKDDNRMAMQCKSVKKQVGMMRKKMQNSNDK